MSVFEAHQPPLVGKRIGSYRVVRLIGQGGMGAVYEAVHEQLERRAAIKVLLPELSRDEEMVGRFLNEARAASGVHHPGIVSIYEIGQLPDGTVFIVMELLEGQTLTDRLDAMAGRPVREALRLCRQVASALAALHKKGVVHRDLKPDNIMVVHDPDVPGGERTKLLDFGIAKVAEPRRGDTSLRTRTGIVMGTPRYMAPEQCRGVGGITDKADVYALGTLLYQLCAGRPPFLAEGVGDLIVQQISEAPPPLRRLEPDVPEAVAELVHAMLEKQPERRPGMAEVAARLERLAEEPSDAAVIRRSGEELLVTPSMFLAPGQTALPPKRPTPPRSSAPGLRVATPLPTDGPTTFEPFQAPDGRGAPLGDGDRPPSLRSLGTGGPIVLDESVAPGPRRGRAGLVLGALLALCTVAAAFGVRALRPRPQATAQAPSRDGEAALLLLGADADLSARRWEEAAQKAAQVLAMGSVSAATRDLATARQKRAEAERAAQETGRRFTEALGKKDLDQAMALYHQLPADSVYRPEARPAYEKAFPAFAAAHLKAARSLRHAGKCAEAKAQAQAVLAIEAGYTAARKSLAESCGGADEEEDEDEDEAALPLPRAEPAVAPAVTAPAPAVATPSPTAAAPAPAPAPPAVRPAPPAPRPQPAAEDGPALLREAQARYSAGQYRQALDLARGVTGLPGVGRAAWILVGTAGCKLRDVEAVEGAYRRAGADGTRLILQTCANAGVRFDGERFVP